MAFKFGSINIVDKVKLPDPIEWPEITDVPVEYEPIHNTQTGQLVYANGEVGSVKIQTPGAVESNGSISDKQ